MADFEAIGIAGFYRCGAFPLGTTVIHIFLQAEESPASRQLGRFENSKATRGMLTPSLHFYMHTARQIASRVAELHKCRELREIAAMTRIGGKVVKSEVSHLSQSR